jgi:LysM repeat protein
MTFSFRLPVAALVVSLFAGCASQNSAPTAAQAAQQPAAMPVYANEPMPEPVPVTSAAPETPMVTVDYIVQSGDSLWKIANRHQTSVARIKELNGLTSDVIRPGQKLAVPQPATPSP